MKEMKIACIGLGNMGAAIAQRILHAEYDLTVWNRTAAKASPLINLGAKGAPTAADAVSEADVVLTNFMDDQSVLGMFEAEDGILAGMKEGAVHICTSTISPRCAERLTSAHDVHGSHYVSAPIVGRPESVAAGKAISYLGGNTSAIALFDPVCRTYSAQVTVVSDRPCVANFMKLAINYNTISTAELIGETYVFAEKCGVPLEHLRNFYQQMWFSHPAAHFYAEKLRARDFAGPAGFVMKGGLKDIRLMLSIAADVGIPLEIGRIIERKLVVGIDEGMGEADLAAFYEITRREAGLS